jgi:hypothetical protein
MIDKILKYSKILFEPKVSFFIFIVILLSTLVFLDVEGAFVGSFLRFGPGTTKENTAQFLNIKLDTWPKVIIIYLIAFMVSVMRSYHQTVIFSFIHSYSWNPAIDKINYSKKWTYFISIIDPLLQFLLSIIEFYILFTRQLQFIIIQFFGSAIVDIPYALYKLSTKKFTSA